MRNNKQLRRLGAALVALVVIFAIMTVTARPRSEVTAIEKAIATVLYPLQVSTDWVATKVRGVVSTVNELAHLHEENHHLREQIQDAAQALARNELLEAENNRLVGELHMKERSQYPLQTARIISRSSDNWYQTVTINRGSRDGVRLNMAVINWQGLVGKVSQTTPYTAEVQLVMDAGFGQQGFGAGAKLPSGELGLVDTIQGGFLRLKFFSTDPAVTVGQPVFTSGQGTMPAELLIGYVDSEPRRDPAYGQYVSVRPAVDFNKLDVVHVVLSSTDKDRGANAP